MLKIKDIYKIKKCQGVWHVSFSQKFMTELEEGHPWVLAVFRNILKNRFIDCGAKAVTFPDEFSLRPNKFNLNQLIITEAIARSLINTLCGDVMETYEALKDFSKKYLDHN